MEDFKSLIYSLTNLERKVLVVLESSLEISVISKKLNLDENSVIIILRMLFEKNFILLKEEISTFIGLDKFGEKFVLGDLPEVELLNEIVNGVKLRSDLEISLEKFSAAVGILKKEKLISIKNGQCGLEFEFSLLAKGWLEENRENPLKLFQKPIEKSALTDVQKRVLEKFKLRNGFFKEVLVKKIRIDFLDFGQTVAKLIKKEYLNLNLLETLDEKTLKSGNFGDKKFRFYDIGVKTSIPDLGRAHPMFEANQILSDVFVEMGFVEMCGPMVESAFWNMDALWIPQDHPARDEQDTFYLPYSLEVPKSYIKKVLKLHEIGIKRSHTPKGDFSPGISEKALLRTHSTSTSFRYLAELGEKLKKGSDINGKYFYVANVFRNEAVDATHLAEFFQGEGFIIGDDLSLADLMGFVKEFYGKLGINKIRFKPTFNPYTEPSMEAHYYDEKLRKWYALINSGVFRSETLKAFGLENKTVIAWGMGASRVASLLAKKGSMRDITGYTCDFSWLKTRENLKREL